MAVGNLETARQRESCWVRRRSDGSQRGKAARKGVAYRIQLLPSLGFARALQMSWGPRTRGVPRKREIVADREIYAILGTARRDGVADGVRRQHGTSDWVECAKRCWLLKNAVWTTAV